ncbi:MAG: hypothetical protein M1835_005380 [Candelina submexicana]|nr:MAG: hypothetical protein M1835_005380 [Candelina submexicana]
MATAVSPSSSPRLPSPPPITEVQIGPKSPTIADSISGNQMELAEPSNNTDFGGSRRTRPGTKAEDISTGPPLVPLSELDTAFQLQEHLQALYNSVIRPADQSHTVPITRESAVNLASPPENTDRALWLYELCRFLTNKMNNFIIAFFAEDPPCSSQTCPEMRASEWQYLCAVHDPPKSCCAIDYCCHTLDWASNTLTSTKHFPSRLTLGSEISGGSQQGVRQLTNIFRRLYRIFAHAWFQHRHVFWQVEAQDGLYVFFKTVCDLYNLIPEDSYTVPPEAEGIETTPVARGDGSRGLTVLRKEPEVNEHKEDEKGESTVIATGQTTRRHKATPSTGAAVNTVVEEEEEEHKGLDEVAKGDEEGRNVEGSHQGEDVMDKITTPEEGVDEEKQPEHESTGADS